jgi:hypothetical protein
VRAAALVALALLAGAAHAKPWARWAPAPLASDSAFAAFSALSADSLAPEERAWLAVQRDWRAQRIEESSRSSASVTAYHPHPPRATDERFAALASLPYAALADSERTWLVAENAAQRRDRSMPEGQGKSSRALGFFFVGAIVGFLAALAALAYAIDHAFP